MMKLLAIRPEPGLSSTLETARALGLDIIGEPLFEIRPIAWDCPASGEVDALLIGSANAVLHAGEDFSGLTQKPVYAVGQTTADAAVDAGFAVAATGQGGLQNVLDAIATPMRLLRIAGAEHVRLNPPAGVTIQTVIAYESTALPISAATLETVGDQPLVLLHSAVAARHFASECDRLPLNRDAITLAVLGPRIAEAAGAGWRSVHISPQPSDTALLEMIRKLCV